MHADTPLPWWIEEGDQRCGFCLQRYSSAMEFRCTACDAPVCPLCTLTHTEERHIISPSCVTMTEGE